MVCVGTSIKEAASQGENKKSTAARIRTAANLTPQKVRPRLSAGTDPSGVMCRSPETSRLFILVDGARMRSIDHNDDSHNQR